MVAAVVVERDGEGRLVVRKRPLPTGGEGAVAALRAEAAWLRRAAGPGVVALVDDGSGRADELVTHHAGAHTWRTGLPDPAAAARLAAGLLRRVERLHRQGLAHGAIGPDHVVLGVDGPVLCSPRPGVGDPAEDRLALADLFGEAIQRWAGTGVTLPDHAGWVRAVDLLRRPASGWALDDIAALLEPTPAGTGRHRRGRGARRLGALAGHRGAVAVVAALGLVSLGALAVPRVRFHTEPAVRPTSAGPAAAPVTGVPVPARTGAASTSLADPATQDRSVGADAGRYRTLDDGGVLATAATPCPGTPPAAVLQPRTGEVWAFTALPASDQEVRGVPVQRVPGADGLETRADGGCQRIVAVGPAGEAAVPAAAPG